MLDPVMLMEQLFEALPRETAWLNCRCPPLPGRTICLARSKLSKVSASSWRETLAAAAAMLSTGRQVKGIKAAGTALLRRFLASAPELGEALCKSHSLSAARDHCAAKEIKVSADTMEDLLNNCPCIYVCPNTLQYALASCKGPVAALPCRVRALMVYWLLNMAKVACARGKLMLLCLQGTYKHACAQKHASYVPNFARVLEDKAAEAHSQL